MIYIVAGVSGCGKTTIGRLLAAELAIPFYDGDDYHPEANKLKMAGGTPLTDEDRWPWLDILGENIISWEKQGGAVLACSALTESYRERLATIDRKNISFIFLTGDQELVAKRLASRSHEFYNNSLLDSQYELLDVPEYGLNIDIDQSTEDILKEVLSRVQAKSFVGLIGLGVMGKSLALNIARNKFSISVFNRHVPGKEEDVAKNFVEANNDHQIIGFDDLKKFIASLERPRNIILMVNAGKPVDSLIEDLLPLLEKGDQLIDAGNSLYKNTIRREGYLAVAGIHFMGAGVSGGEEGALKGPSIMPGGDPDAYNNIAPVFEAIAAKDKSGEPCVTYIGPDGSGHFVKMVHNGIEYAEMQLLAEVYQFLRFHSGISSDEIADIFEEWNSTPLSSYLLEISIDILRAKENGEPLLDKVLDQSASKGTGGWTTEASIRYGRAASTISEALTSRFVSASKEQRLIIEKNYSHQSDTKVEINLDVIKYALQEARIINHIIGFEIIREASKQNQWEINIPELARIWTNGCIIRSELMEVFSKITPTGDHLLINPAVKTLFGEQIDQLKEFVTVALNADCGVPVFSAALNYFLQMKTGILPATIIQAQRDYFGAHTYRRTDDPEGIYHSNWQDLAKH